MGPLGAKIADEFIHPKPPGHVLVMLQTAEALGLTKDEILREPMLPEARAILDFKRGLLWEGTVAEWWFSMLTEEPIGHWAATWFKTLTTKYGFNPQQAIYFSTHEEADLKEHDDGVMGHGSFNRMVMQRILEDGYADTREGYNLEYCATAAVDLYGDHASGRGRTGKLDGQPPLKLMKSRPIKKVQMRGARRSTSGGVLGWYVVARRASATKQMSLFQRSEGALE